MVKSVALIRANIVFPFVAFLDGIGVPRQKFLQPVRIPASALDHPENLIPMLSVFTLLEAIAQYSENRFFGVEMGLNTAIEHLGAFGRLVRHSLTLYDLIDLAAKSIHLYNSGDRVWLTYEDDQVWLHHYSCLPTNAEFPQQNLYAVMLYLNAIHLVSGPGWQPPEIHLMSRQNHGLSDFELFSNTQFSLGQPADAIRFPRAFLSRSLRHRLPYPETQRQQDQRLLQISAPALDFPRSVQQVLRLLLPEGYPDINIAAEIAGMSVRSFQRRLAEEGLSYSRLVEQVRFDAAIDYLKDPNIKLIDIALELGYRDPANFTRAFKRWTGISPRAFRDQLDQT